MQKVTDEKMLHKAGGVYALHVLHGFIFGNSLNTLPVGLLFSLKLQ